MTLLRLLLDHIRFMGSGPFELLSSQFFTWVAISNVSGAMISVLISAARRLLSIYNSQHFDVRGLGKEIKALGADQPIPAVLQYRKIPGKRGWIAREVDDPFGFEIGDAFGDRFAEAGARWIDQHSVGTEARKIRIVHRSLHGVHQHANVIDSRFSKIHFEISSGDRIRFDGHDFVEIPGQPECEETRSAEEIECSSTRAGGFCNRSRERVEEPRVRLNEDARRHADAIFSHGQPQPRAASRGQWHRARDGLFEVDTATRDQLPFAIASRRIIGQPGKTRFEFLDENRAAAGRGKSMRSMAAIPDLSRRDHHPAAGAVSVGGLRWSHGQHHVTR